MKKIFLFIIAMIAFYAVDSHAEETLVSEEMEVDAMDTPVDMVGPDLPLPVREKRAQYKLNKLRGIVVKLSRELRQVTKANAEKRRKRDAVLRRKMAKRDAEIIKRKKELSKLKTYKGHIQLGNFMKGGPKAKPSIRTWLSDYQHRQFAKPPTKKDLALRKRIGQRLQELYKKAKIPEHEFLTEFLKEAGAKKIIPEVLNKTWKKAKNWLLKQQFKQYLSNAEIKKELIAAKKARLAEAKKKKKAENDPTDYSVLPNPELFRLQRIEAAIAEPSMDEERIRGTPESVEFYGCVNCKAPKSAKIKRSTEFDTPEHAKELEKGYKAPQITGVGAKAALKDAKKQAKIDIKLSTSKSKKKGGKKASKKNKKKKDVNNRKIGNVQKSAAQVKKEKDARKKKWEAYKKKQTPKLTIDNKALLTHLLDRYGIERNPDDVSTFMKEVKERIKDRVVERQLSESERKELLLAKVESLESSIAARSGVPAMVPKLKNPYVKPERTLPEFEPPKVRKDAKAQMKRDVAIAFGTGYLDDRQKVGHTDLDHAITLNDDAQTYSEQLRSKGMTHMPDKPVWPKFDGPEGDSQQQRSKEVNDYRKANWNKPLPDGSQPW